MVLSVVVPDHFLRERIGRHTISSGNSYFCSVRRRNGGDGLSEILPLQSARGHILGFQRRLSRPFLWRASLRPTQLLVGDLRCHCHLHDSAWNRVCPSLVGGTLGSRQDADGQISSLLRLEATKFLTGNTVLC